MELETIINTALQYNPQDRFQSVDAMKEALLMVARKTGALNRIQFTSKINPENQVKPLWSFKCEDEIRGTPLVEDGIVYVGSYDSNLYALDAAEGAFMWKYAAEGGVVGQPALHDGVIYFGSEDNRLFSVAARTGRLIWAFPTGGPIRSSPRIVEGHIVVGSDDGYLHAINPVSARILWQVDAGGAIRDPLHSSPRISFTLDVKQVRYFVLITGEKPSGVFVPNGLWFPRQWFPTGRSTYHPWMEPYMRWMQKPGG
jgi:outer membrane protein assembly factor BamB